MSEQDSISSRYIFIYLVCQTSLFIHHGQGINYEPLFGKWAFIMLIEGDVVTIDQSSHYDTTAAGSKSKPTFYPNTVHCKFLLCLREPTCIRSYTGDQKLREGAGEGF